MCTTLILVLLLKVYPKDVSLKRLNYIEFQLEDQNLSLKLLPDNSFEQNESTFLQTSLRIQPD